MLACIPDLRFRLDELEGRMPERIRWRLINGELFMAGPSGGLHGLICANLMGLLGCYRRETNAGSAFGAETGFVLTRKPDTVLAPDASFITIDRAGLITEKFIDGPPDLAVEVISPSQSAPNATEKAEQWLELGAQMVWLVWPRKRCVTVHEASKPDRTLGPGDHIDGIGFMPGFACSIDDILD